MQMYNKATLPKTRSLKIQLANDLNQGNFLKTESKLQLFYCIKSSNSLG